MPGHGHGFARPDPHGHDRLGAAVEHVGNKRGARYGRERDRRLDQPAGAEVAHDLLGSAVELAFQRQADLARVGLLGGDEARLVAVAVHRQDVEPVGRAVAAIRHRDAPVVVGAAPPRSRHGGQHVVVVRHGPRPSLGVAEIMVLGGVRVAREAHRVAPPGEQPEQVGAVGEIDVRPLGIEVVLQRDVQHHDDQRVVRHVGEEVAHEGELVGVEPAHVGGRVLGPVWVGPEIGHVVEHQEHGFGVGERIGGRAEHALVGFAAVTAVGRLEIEVVVAADVVPGDTDRADDPVQPVVHGQVVVHDVAGRQSEPGLRAGKRVHHVLADEIHLGVGLGLRVGEQDHVEPVRLVLPEQLEVDRLRQRTRGFDPRISEPERGRRPAGLVDAMEARQHGAGIHRRHEARGLDHKHDRLVRDGQRVAAVGPRDHDLAPVRHEHAGQAPALAVDDLEHLSRREGGGVVVGPRRRAAQRRRGPARRRREQYVAPREPEGFVGHGTTLFRRLCGPSGLKRG